MQVNDGLATFGGEEEGAVFLVVHEEILGEDCRAERVLEDVERLLEVWIAVGIVHAKLVAGKVILGGVTGIRKYSENGIRSAVGIGNKDAVKMESTMQ